jgi:hypothetical protein
LASGDFAAACEIVSVDNVESDGNVRSRTPSHTATLNDVPDFEIPVVAVTESTTSDVIEAALVFTETI